MTSRALGRNDRLDDDRRDQHATAPTRWSDRSWWPWARRAFTVGFLAVVGALLWRYAQHVDWEEVWTSLKELPRPALLLAVGLAATSHLLYSCFDLLGRRYTGHSLRARTVMAINFISYAFNLTIGSIVGGVGFRYRLYSQAGLSNGVITRIVSMSMLTNWLGYKLLAGLLFIFHPLQLPPAWHMGNHGLQWAGLVLVAISGAYIVSCVRMGDRRWEVRGHELYLPPWRMALLQMAVSCTNWMLMAGVVYVLLQQQVNYTDVLTVLLVGAIAGVFAHVPAGLGVFEFVFVALLSHRVSEGRLLAALLGYRAIYYIVPTLIAAALYLAFEIKAKRNSTLVAEAG
ncbi:MAG: YbhN family protein [Ramlibacter sp.]